MFAGAMAVLMVLSAVNVSGWGVINAKAEETTEITLADGASLLVDGAEHTHNTDGDVTYTWKDDKC